MNLEGNKILITGASKGIGLGFLERLVEKNEILAVSRNLEELEKLKEKYPSIDIFACDLSEPYERERLASYIEVNFRRMNVLINNAGIQKYFDLSEEKIDFGDFDEIRLNLEAPIHLNNLLLGTLRLNENPVIINVSSGLAFHTMASVPVYSATKAALHSYTKSLRHALKNDGIKVIEIIPPAVDTELNFKGRQERGIKFDLKVPEFCDDIIQKLATDADEVAFANMMDDINNKTKKDREKIFEFMNR